MLMTSNVSCGYGPSDMRTIWRPASPCQGTTLQPGLAAEVSSGSPGTADVLSVTIWLVPARKENIAVNVPPYLNAETTVLQDINDTGYFQASAQAPSALGSSSMLPGLIFCPDTERRFHACSLCRPF